MNTQSKTDTWHHYAQAIYTLLDQAQASDAVGNALDINASFALWRNMTLKIREQRKELYIIGNGASASIASHCAADIMKNGGVRSHVFTDLSLLTALGNDLSYEEVFSWPLRKLCAPGDMCIAISSSGRSPNIHNAARVVRQQGGVVVTLSGFGADNALRTMGDLNFYIAAQSYGLVESCHASLMHHWMDIVIDCQA